MTCMAHVAAAAAAFCLHRMFGPTIPEHSIILLLGIVFSVLAPLVLVAAVIFFGMALLVESYNWVSVEPHGHVDDMGNMLGTEGVYS